MDSVLFHLNILEFIKQKGIEHLEKHELNTDPTHLRKVIYEVYYCFDDLIFNICSLFDYLGNLVGYLYLGESKSQIKWNGIVKTCFDKNSKIDCIEIREILTKENSKYINHLYEYRSKIIHYHKDGSDVEHTMHFEDDGIVHSLLIKTPERYFSTLKNLRTDENQDITINAYDICLTSFMTVTEILKILTSDIVPKTKKAMEEIYNKYREENSK